MKPESLAGQHKRRTRQEQDKERHDTARRAASATIPDDRSEVYLGVASRLDDFDADSGIIVRQNIVGIKDEALSSHTLIVGASGYSVEH